MIVCASVIEAKSDCSSFIEYSKELFHASKGYACDREERGVKIQRFATITTRVEFIRFVPQKPRLGTF